MTNNRSKTPALLGNTFPISLLRRRVVVEPASLPELKLAIKTRGVVSFWGHENTIEIANALLETDVRPATPRPALRLAVNGWPQLDDRTFDECWVVSPDLMPGYRPASGAAVDAGRILGWQVLRFAWSETERVEQR